MGFEFVTDTNQLKGSNKIFVTARYRGGAPADPEKRIALAAMPFPPPCHGL